MQNDSKVSHYGNTAANAETYKKRPAARRRMGRKGDIVWSSLAMWIIVGAIVLILLIVVGRVFFK